MREYIDRVPFVGELLDYQFKNNSNKIEIAEAIRLVNSKPKADVVEVVRCKDCIYSRPLCHTEKKLYNDDCVGCTKISTSYHSVIMNDNCYCSYGERKKDDA